MGPKRMNEPVPLCVVGAPTEPGAPDLRAPVVALSLAGLRRQVEALMLPDEVIVTLNLDKAARLERDRRRLTGRPRPGFAGTSA